MEKIFAVLVNYLWKECIKNLNMILTEQEAGKFSNNDYYYMLIINSLKNPRFSDVSNALGLTKPAVSAMIRKLGNMGLVKKVQSEKDKRVFYIILTEKGNSIINGDIEMYNSLVETIRSITKDEYEYAVIEKTLKILVQTLTGGHYEE